MVVWDSEISRIARVGDEARDARRPRRRAPEYRQHHYLDMAEAPAATSSTHCAFCSTEFISRTQLFKHLVAAHGLEQQPTKRPKAPKAAAKPKHNKFACSHLPYIVCASGFWYFPAVTPPPKPKAPLKGVETHKMVRPSRETAIGDLAAIGRDSVRRTLMCCDSVEWLKTQPMLPRRCHVVTSLPDSKRRSPQICC